MQTKIIYTALVGLVVVERLIELAVSMRHCRSLARQGAVEVGAGHYPWMVVVHTGFLISCLAEVWLLDRPWIAVLGLPMIGLLLLSIALRWWVVATLGERWTTRVMVLPSAPLVTRGPFRWIRHPNYVAVVAELAALPLVHTAWLTATVFGLANALILRTRIRVEDRALRPDRGRMPLEAR